jgi:hypothetical protein
LLNSGNSESCQTCFRNFEHIISYIADETGLFYCAMMDGSLSYKHAALSGSEKVMYRVTVLCCSNMSGTDMEAVYYWEKG